VLAQHLLSQILVPVDVEQQERSEETISLRMSLDELTIQAIVLTNLIFTAHIEVIAELLDVHRVVEVLVLKVVHVLTCGAVESHNRLARIRPCDVQRVHCEIQTIRIVDTGIGPNFIKPSLPDIDPELELRELCVTSSPKPLEIPIP